MAPEAPELIEFLIERTKDAKSPVSITKLSREYKEKSGAKQTVHCLRARINKIRSKIHSLKNIDKNTKVKMIFALRVPVNVDFLKKLKRDALVEVDDERRITRYKANGGSLELRGGHSRSYKKKSGCQKLIRNYFKNRDNTNGNTMNEKEEEMRNLIDFITKKCENVISSLSIRQLIRDFKIQFKISTPTTTIHSRIRGYCREIQLLGHMDTQTKVKQLFGLSASVDPNCLEELRKEAVVEVDNLGRITKYAANDHSLKLQGDHSFTAKTKVGWIQRKKNKTANSFESDGDEGDESEKQDDYSDEDSDEYSSDESDSEFDSENENNVDEPEELMDPSNEVDDLDYETPVRRRSPSELTVDDDFAHGPSSKTFLRSDKSKQKADENKKHEFRKITGKEKTAEKSSEKLSKRRSSVRKNTIAKIGNGGRNRMTRELVDDENDKKTRMAEDAEDSDEEEELGSKDVTTRSGRVLESRVSDVAPIFKTAKSSKRKTDKGESSSSKRTRLPPDNSMAPENVDDYNPNLSTENAPSVELKPFRGSVLDNEHEIERDEDIRRIQKPYPDIQVPHENTQIMEAPANSKEVLNDVDANGDVQILERSPLSAPEYIVIDDDEDTPQIPKSPQELQKPKEEEVAPTDTAPVKKELQTESAETLTSQIKFLEAIKSLVVSLDMPSLSHVQSKILQKIWKIGESNKVISNEEMILAMELLVARMTNNSVLNLSENVESVSLREFLCYVKAAILNSKLAGLDSLLEKIKGRIKDPALKDKNIPVEKVASALQATLDDICF